MKNAPKAPTTIDEYIAGFPSDVQPVLQRVRRTIQKAIPKAEEAISYRIPTYKIHGKYVIYFAGWQEHYSLYPSNARIEAAFKRDLAPYEVSGRGTIRFPLAEPVPSKLIAAITKFRAREVAGGSARPSGRRVDRAGSDSAAKGSLGRSPASARTSDRSAR